VAQFINFV